MRCTERGATSAATSRIRQRGSAPQTRQRMQLKKRFGQWWRRALRDLRCGHSSVVLAAVFLVVWQLPKGPEWLANPGVRRALLALGFTVMFAVSARWVRAVSPSGAVAGGIIALMLALGGGLGAFAGLVAVFLLALLTTRGGYGRKRALGTAEHGSGRTASQVLANLSIAAVLAVISSFSGHPAGWLIAAAAALAEAAADTVSSEFGQAVSSRAYLVTNFRLVAVGTDGGISWQGTIAGAVAAVLVAGVCALSGMIELRWVLATAGAGTLGMFVDSFLGASLERRGLIGNDAVNFTSTAVAAFFALFLYWSRHGDFLPL